MRKVRVSLLKTAKMDAGADEVKNSQTDPVIFLAPVVVRPNPDGITEKKE